VPQEHARVIDADKTSVTLQIHHQQGCQSCSLSNACGTASLGRLIGFRGLEIRLENTLGLNAGDQVILSIPDRAYLLASLLIYMLPLLVMLMVAAIFDFFGFNDGWVAVSGALGLGAGLWFSGRLARFSFSQALQPKMMRQLF
jgi:sigma-E factor negative regulatory protein RseC